MALSLLAGLVPLAQGLQNQAANLCLLQVNGHCLRHPAVSTWAWFDDSQKGGPRSPSHSACLERSNFWQQSCGGSATVRAFLWDTQGSRERQMQANQILSWTCSAMEGCSRPLRKGVGEVHMQQRTPRLECYLERYGDLRNAFCGPNPAHSAAQGTSSARCRWGGVVQHWKDFGFPL